MQWIALIAFTAVRHNLIRGRSWLYKVELCSSGAPVTTMFHYSKQQLECETEQAANYPDFKPDRPADHKAEFRRARESLNSSGEVRMLLVQLGS